MRCPHDGAWKIDTQTLSAVGMFENAMTYEIGMTEARTCPNFTELRAFAWMHRQYTRQQKFQYMTIARREDSHLIKHRRIATDNISPAKTSKDP
jgi:hypothetical protein